MNTIRLFLLSPLGELVLRLTLLLTIAWLANAVMRRSHPRRRLILWRSVLVLSCLLPLGGIVPIKVFRIDGNAAPARRWAPTNSSPRSVVGAASALPIESSATLAAAESLLTIKSGALWVALVWLVGGTAGAIRLLLLQFRLSRLRRGARAPDSELLVLARDIQIRLGVRQAVAVRVSDEVTSPLVCGLLHPTVILPAGLLRTLPPVQIRALLSHEMAHVQSHDLAWCIGWRWMKTLCWIHPLIWNVPAAHNLACEQEADRVASDLWADRSLYTRMLAQLALQVMRLPAVETTLALSGASQIVKRLALLRLDGFRGWKWRDSLAGLVLVAGLAVITAGWGFSTARAESPADDIAQRVAEQQRPRKVVPFEPRQFDKYVGFYQMVPNVYFTVTRKGDHFLTRLTGQQDVEVYPESPTKFFATVVAAQVSFVTNAEGNTTELVLHQGGMEQHAPKVDESVVKKGETAIAERMKHDTPDPDRDPPLRRFIDAAIKGQPNLDDMGPGLIAATNSQWPRIQKDFQKLGALKALAFKGVDPQGGDLYIGTFENGEMKFHIGPLNSDHKMEALWMSP